MWRRIVFSLFFVLLLAGRAGAQEKTYEAERFDVDVVVREDGSLAVTETVTFDFDGGPFTFVFRELESDFTDGITDIEAAVDGRPLLRGDQPGQVKISGDETIRVAWRLEPFGDMTRTFTLRYRMLGVVRQTEQADLLLYQALPDAYEYTIASSTITFSYPSSAEIEGDVRVTTGNGQAQRLDNRVVVAAQELGPEETLTVQIPFAPGSLISEAPAWQQRQLARQEAAPLWVASAGIVFVLGLIALAAVYRRHSPQSVEAPRLVYEPPSDLAPALAGAINGSGADPAWSNALATLFDLADRRVLEIEELDERRWFRKHEFVIKLVSQPDALRPHERGLLEVLFETKQGPTEQVKLSELSKRISSRQWKQFEEPLKEELKAAGLISEERKKVRVRLIGGGMAIIVLSIVVAVAVAMLDNRPALALAASVFLLGLVVSIAGAALSPLSDEGAARAAVWQRFADHLKDVTKGKAAVSGPDMFRRFLPYAASYGLLEAWAKWFQKEGWTELPPYFHALARAEDGGAAAFVALAAVSSSSGGSAAGAAGGAGGGAAGGGASGAG